MNDPRTQPGTMNADDLPSDQVALMIWHAGAPGGMTIIITCASWDMNKKVVMDAGGFIPERIYEFESPVNAKGRRRIYQLTGVQGWVANLSTGIVPVRRLDS